MSEGNPQLRALSELKVREILRGQFVNDPKLKDNYYRWLDRYQEAKATYGSDFRGMVSKHPIR